MKVWDFVPEFVEALIDHLKGDDVRWGDTWLKRKRLGQEERFIKSTRDRIDQYENAGAPIDYLAIVGDALICWLRERHLEIWPE